MVIWIKKLITPASLRPLPPEQYHHFLLYAVNTTYILEMHRCKLLLGADPLPTPIDILTQVRKITGEHVIAWSGERIEKSQLWMPPSESMMKWNFDVAIQPHRGIAAATCHNHEGNLIHAFALPLRLGWPLR